MQVGKVNAKKRIDGKGSINVTLPVRHTAWQISLEGPINIDYIEL